MGQNLMNRVDRYWEWIRKGKQGEMMMDLFNVNVVDMEVPESQATLINEEFDEEDDEEAERIALLQAQVTALQMANIARRKEKFDGVQVPPRSGDPRRDGNQTSEVKKVSQPEPKPAPPPPTSTGKPVTGKPGT